MPWVSAIGAYLKARARRGRPNLLAAFAALAQLVFIETRVAVLVSGE